MPEEVQQQVAKLGILQTTNVTLDCAILNSDVLYVTRIQKERFETEEEYEAVKGAYCINADLMQVKYLHTCYIL